MEAVRSSIPKRTSRKVEQHYCTPASQGRQEKEKCILVARTQSVFVKRLLQPLVLGPWRPVKHSFCFVFIVKATAV